MLAIRRLVLDHFSRNIYVKLPIYFLYLLHLFPDLLSPIYMYFYFLYLFFFTLRTTSSKFNKICICICIYTHNCLYVCMFVMLSWFSVLFPGSRLCPQSRVDALWLMHSFLLKHSFYEQRLLHNSFLSDKFCSPNFLPSLA